MGCASCFLKTLFPAGNIFVLRKFTWIAFDPNRYRTHDPICISLGMREAKYAAICNIRRYYAPRLTNPDVGVGALWISNVRSINVRRFCVRRALKVQGRKISLFNFPCVSDVDLQDTPCLFSISIFTRVTSFPLSLQYCLFFDQSSGSVKPGDYRPCEPRAFC